MASLVNRIGAENVFIVSKVGHHGERTWATVLQQSGFYTVTGIRQANVHWVRDRTGPRGKAQMVQQLNLTHFVDDHSDVLCDIRRHFSDQRLSVPELYIVRTTSWDDDDRQARRTRSDTSRAIWAAERYDLQFADNLSAVPFPPPLDPQAHVSYEPLAALCGRKKDGDREVDEPCVPLHGRRSWPHFVARIL
jgi:hypothetical protein